MQRMQIVAQGIRPVRLGIEADIGGNARQHMIRGQKDIVARTKKADQPITMPRYPENTVALGGKLNLLSILYKGKGRVWWYANNLAHTARLHLGVPVCCKGQAMLGEEMGDCIEVLRNIIRPHALERWLIERVHVDRGPALLPQLA